jgi:hypothetical protein
LSEPNTEVAGVKFRFQEGFELDEVEEAEEKGCPKADSDQNDPA